MTIICLWWYKCIVKPASWSFIFVVNIISSFGHLYLLCYISTAVHFGHVRSWTKIITSLADIHSVGLWIMWSLFSDVPPELSVVVMFVQKVIYYQNIPQILNGRAKCHQVANCQSACNISKSEKVLHKGRSGNVPAVTTLCVAIGLWPFPWCHTNKCPVYLK